MENFTPYSSLAGGLLIGISAAIMLLFNGRITGISGITAELISPKSGEWLWRLLFLVGTVLGAVLFNQFYPGAFAIPKDYPYGLLIAGGLLVGIGTRMGSGCTTGHAICGISRLSSRSIVATCVFMTAGGITVFVLRHVIGGWA
jgi:uncharacterized protein